jgi:hypothetical protein
MPTEPRKENAPKESDKKAKDEELDEALDESFPASDPPAATSPGRRFTGAEVGGKAKEENR